MTVTTVGPEAADVVIPAPRQGGTGERRRLEYRDPRSRTRVVVTTPTADPDLWRQYLEGAVRAYRAFDVKRVLDLERFGDGATTSLFFAVTDDDDRVVGGTRFQGPYRSAGQAHALVEWGSDPVGREAVRDMIRDRLPSGVIETKATWVDEHAGRRREVVDVLRRTPFHALSVLGARYALGTAALHARPMWTGAFAADHIAPVAFPDERYRTSLIWWDRHWVTDGMAGDARQLFDGEAAQLAAPAPTAWAGR